MYKLLVLVALLASGCSQFRVTGTMCDNLDPQSQDYPKECRDYDDEKATKAFNKVKDDKKVSNQDIEFDAQGSK